MGVLNIMRQNHLEGCLTAKEAAQYLEVSSSTLSRYVKSGILHPVVAPGKVYGQYSITELDTIKETVIDLHKEPLRKEMGKHRVATFSMATPDDCEEVNALYPQIWEGLKGGINIDRWKKNIGVNKDILFLAKVDGKIVAFAFVIPLKKEFVDRIMATDKLIPIGEGDIQSYDQPDGPISLYYRGMGVLNGKGVTRTERREWGAVILRNLIRFVEALGTKGVKIDYLVSRSGYKDGVTILRHFGFTEVARDEGTEKRAFVVDVETSGIPFVEKYKTAFALSQNPIVEDVE